MSEQQQDAISGIHSDFTAGDQGTEYSRETNLNASYKRVNYFSDDQ